MKLSYNLLKQYVDLNKVDPKSLVDSLTFAGLEVEGIEQLASGTNLVVGHVLTKTAHPDSDHLNIVEVDVKEEVLQIVCGAPNVDKGQKVIVAKVGAKLPEITILAGKIRGVESNGMICSLAELGVDKKHLAEEQVKGIEVLSNDAPIGADALAYLGLDDVIYDISLTPNRNDCLALYNVAKEVGAILNRTVNLPTVENTIELGKETDLKVGSTTENCPVFLGKVINQITIKESPKWLKDALLANGVKSINNVVDISNFVMLETGQPLHFYDIDSIKTKEITVVEDYTGPYLALDENEYEIHEKDLMIMSNQKPVGIAGVMGGEDSKILDTSRGLIIEAAIFNHVSIRNTARNLNLQTEASLHFQKGIEPLAPYKAMDRAVSLLVELADASDIEKTAVYDTLNYKPRVVETTLAYLNNRLATSFDLEVVIDVFKRLDFNPTVNGDSISVVIPSYRTDIEAQVDLSEEVIRLLGFENVPSTLPYMPSTIGKLAKNEKERYVIKNILNGFGFAEAMTYSLVSKKHIDLSVMSVGQPVELANPLSEERRYFRTSITPSILDAVGYNQARSIDSWGLFEIASIYNNDGVMQERLSLALSHKAVLSRWLKTVNVNDFYVMKGRILELLEQLGFDEKRIFIKENNTNRVVFHPNQSAEVYIGRELLGVFGVIHPKIEGNYYVEKCVLAELNLSVLYANKPSKVKYTPFAKYPSVSYDVAVILNDEITAEKVVSIIKKVGGKLVVNIEIFDVYKGKNIADNQKSMGVNIVYQSMEKTLTDKDIQPEHTRILEALKNELGAIYREG